MSWVETLAAFMLRLLGGTWEELDRETAAQEILDRPVTFRYRPAIVDVQKDGD